MLNERESLVKAMKMIPVECVVRNVCAGSMAKRYGIAEGTRLAEPIFEFFLKSDALHDPLCNEDHIRVLGWASAARDRADEDADPRRQRGLQPLFADAGIDLVDYKLEFGHPLDDPTAPLMLGDEFTPDGCRLWDAKTGEKLDKDRFRRDLGSVIEHYREVGAAHRRAAVAADVGRAAQGIARTRGRRRPARRPRHSPSVVAGIPAREVSLISSKRLTSGVAAAGVADRRAPRAAASILKRCRKWTPSTITSGSMARSRVVAGRCRSSIAWP